MKARDHAPRPLRRVWRILLIIAMTLVAWRAPAAGAACGGGSPAATPAARYVILLIGDGMGANHLAAANRYTGSAPAYQAWLHTWISTFPAGGGYDGAQAWANFAYVLGGPTDSAAAATALYTGVKTANIRISAATGGGRLTSITDKARAQGRAVGAVSSVQISHATPGAWIAHNASRANGFAIADEGLWGDPNTTGTVLASPYYAGGLGVTLPPVDVLIGGGHPAWGGGSYVNTAMRDKLAAESGAAGAFTFVERRAGQGDGGVRLLAAASALTGDPPGGAVRRERRQSALSAGRRQRRRPGKPDPGRDGAGRAGCVGPGAPGLRPDDRGRRDRLGRPRGQHEPNARRSAGLQRRHPGRDRLGGRSGQRRRPGPTPW